MGKKLNSLIRLHKFRVDEKRREIAGVISIIEDLERQSRELDERITREQPIASRSPQEAGVLFGNYVAHHIFKKEQFLVALKELEEKLVSVQEELREEFRELKGVELTQDARNRVRVIERNRAEQLTLDEIGAEVYRRKDRP